MLHLWRTLSSSRSLSRAPLCLHGWIVHMYHPCSSAVLCDKECDQRCLLQIPFERHRSNGIAQDILYYQQVICLHIVRFLRIIHTAKKFRLGLKSCTIIHLSVFVGFFLCFDKCHSTSQQLSTFHVLFFAPVITDCEIFVPVEDFFFSCC